MNSSTDAKFFKMLGPPKNPISVKVINQWQCIVSVVFHSITNRSKQPSFGAGI
jgi:hypothetical protein